MRVVAAIAVTTLSLGTESARSDAVTKWNAIMQQTVDVPSVEPFLRLRSAAITQLAVFEAVNSIECNYTPYRNAVPAPRSASAEAAAVAAAHRALSVLHPQSAPSLDALRDASLESIPEGRARDSGIRVGVAAADAIIALRAHDGSDTEVPYTPGTEPGEWQPTPPDFFPAFRPGLGQVKPFALEHGAQFRIGPPPPLYSAMYARDYNEVKALGEINATRRSKYGTDIARYYEATEPGPIFNPAARQVSEAQERSLAENARIFALLNMAIFDAAVAVFDAKYFYNLWRPVTAIPAGNLDHNPRTEPVANWQPLVYTLPFPTYPSGHGSFAGAARRVLEALLGKEGHSITLTNASVPEIVLQYSSWKEIAQDIHDARVYGGVHFRFDQTAAARQGRRVGRYILRNQLLPVSSAKRKCHADKHSHHPSK
jgi:hypothetical protein